MGKPFVPGELLARIEDGLRRKKGASALNKDKPVEFGPFVFDPATRQLFKDRVLIKLTGGDVNLLEALVSNPVKALSSDRLLALARDAASAARTYRATDIHALPLRRSLPAHPRQPPSLQPP